MRILSLSTKDHPIHPIRKHVSRCPKVYDRDTLKKGASGACLSTLPTFHISSPFLTPSHYHTTLDLYSPVLVNPILSILHISIQFIQKYFLPFTYYFASFFNLHFIALPTNQRVFNMMATFEGESPVPSGPTSRQSSTPQPV